MQGLKGCALDSAGNSIRKKRSNMPRHPRADDIIGYDSTSRCALGVSAVDRVGGGEFGGYKRSRKDDGASREHDGFSHGHFENGGGSGLDFVRCNKGGLAPANWKSVKSFEESQLHSRKDNSMGNVSNAESRSVGNSGVNSDGLGNGNKLRKVKLKVGGVTHTIHAKPASNGASGGGFGSSSMKTFQSVDGSRPRKKLILQETSDDDNSPSKAVCKSKRVPKPRLLDEAFDDGNDDEEI